MRSRHRQIPPVIRAEPADAPESPEDCTGREPETPAAVSIFRPRAVERYARGGGEQVLPRLATPRELVWLWVLVILLALGAFAAGWYLDSWTEGAAVAVAEQAR